MRSSENHNEASPKDHETSVLCLSRTVYGMIFCVVLGGVVVMLGMKTSPQYATAMEPFKSKSESEKTGHQEILKFEYQPLPVDPNKHNQLARDFMGSSSYKTSDGLWSETCLKKELSRTDLNLKAIVWGEKASAVINDCLVEEGQILTIMTDQSHDIEVIDIRETSVLLRCDDELIELRLTDK